MGEPNAALSRASRRVSAAAVPLSSRRLSSQSTNGTPNMSRRKSSSSTRATPKKTKDRRKSSSAPQPPMPPASSLVQKREQSGAQLARIDENGSDSDGDV